MEKKNVNVSQQLLSSIFIGFMVSYAFVFIAHLLPKDWSFMPEDSGGGFFNGNSRVLYCGYTCVLGQGHAGNCDGLTASTVGSRSLGVGELFSAPFDRHTSLLLVVGISSALIIYILKKVNFNIVKE